MTRMQPVTCLQQLRPCSTLQSLLKRSGLVSEPGYLGHRLGGTQETDLQGDLVEVAIQGSQHCLVSDDADTLALPLNLNDDRLQSLDNIKVALPTWIPARWQQHAIDHCITPK